MKTGVAPGEGGRRGIGDGRWLNATLDEVEASGIRREGSEPQQAREGGRGDDRRLVVTKARLLRALSI